MGKSVAPELLRYYASGKPLACELDSNPLICEFWPRDQLHEYNDLYQVPLYAPGFFGFGTNGSGEMLAIAPSGAVVCLPLIGMEPSAAWQVADSWQSFEAMLRDAV